MVKFQLWTQPAEAFGQGPLPVHLAAEVVGVRKKWPDLRIMGSTKETPLKHQKLLLNLICYIKCYSIYMTS